MTTKYSITAKALLKTIIALSFFVGASWFVGCTDSTSSPGTASSSQPKMTTSTKIEHNSVTPTSIIPKQNSIAEHNWGTTADSVVITRARIVISAMKMHLLGASDIDDDDNHGHGHDHDKDHDEDSHWGWDDGTIMAGPFIAEWDATGEKIISTVVIPAGTYDRIKFEIHKLNENEDASLLNDPLFGDFVNGGRYTVLIDGISFVNGVGYPFSYRSSLTANLQVFLDPPATFDSVQAYNLTLVFDPVIIFGMPGMRPLDPRDPDNHGIIDGMIKSSIRALRTKR
jgi:hypothetical protein